MDGYNISNCSEFYCYLDSPILLPVFAAPLSTMLLSDLDQRGVVAIIVTSLLAVIVIFCFTLLSVFLVAGCKTILGYVVQFVWLTCEVFIALVAALTSGSAVTLSILAAAFVSSFTLPPNRIEARVIVAALVASSGTTLSAIVALYFSTIHVQMEVATGIVSAAGVAVGCAAAWAVGVVSLIERETQSVGMRMVSLLDCVRHNSHRFLRILIKLHVGLKQADLDLALMHAVKVGYPECTEILLNNGARVNAKDPHGNTPIIVACEMGLHKIAEILIRHKCDINTGNSMGHTALHHCSKWGYERCLKLLLDSGADVNVKDLQFHTPLILACGHAHQANLIIKMLLDAGADVRSEGLEARTALHYAAGRGLDISLLLDAKADPNAVDVEGFTPLHMAAQEASYSVIENLLKVGCNPNALTSRERTPLHLASNKGNLRCIKLLVDSGGDMFLPDASGNLPVWYAASQGFSRTLQYFVSHNVPLGPYCEDGVPVKVSNPLQVALERKHFLVAKVLLLGGCEEAPLHTWMEDIPPSAYREFHNLSLIDWLRNHATNPPCLLQKCRLVIRKCLGRHLLEKHKELPLPITVKKFIMMDDVEDELGSVSPISDTMLSLSSFW